MSEVAEIVPSVSESPEVLSTDTDSIVQSGESRETEQPETQERPTESAEQSQSPDGRKIPTQWREIFKTDSKLRGVYFSEQAFRQTFPEGPNQAKALAQKWESFGGDDAIAAHESERGYWKQLDQNYMEGKPEFIEELIKADPDAFEKAVPTALDKFAQSNRPAYDHLMARVVVNTIQGQMTKLWNFLNSKEETKAAASELAQWYGTLEELATKQPEKKIDPERAKFEKEKTDFEQSKQEQFVTGVRTDAESHLRSSIDTALGREFTKIGRKLDAEKKADPDAYRLLVKNCSEAISEAIGKDTGYQPKMKQLLASGNKDRALKFATARIDSVTSEAVARTVQRFYKFFNRSTSKPNVQKTNGQEVQAGAIPLGRIPDSKELDWPRMNRAGVKPIDGKAYLKGKKELVTF